MITQNNKIRKVRNVIMTAAAVLAIGGALWAHQEVRHTVQLSSYLVWFEVHADGTAVNASNGLSGSNPFGCSGSSSLCARSLLYDSTNPTSSQVTYNAATDTYSIKTGVDITNDYQSEIEKSVSLE